jgi:hypothetical protein
MISLSLPHKVLDYACPVNGLEDLYEQNTGVRLPGYLLMDLSSIGFTYIRQMRAPAPRMVNWGSGMGHAQYQFLAQRMGFSMRWSEGRSFGTSWRMALDSLSQGSPVILGVLDMFHLPYFPKFYHRFHIPQHYVLLVGYDDAARAALVQDTGLPGVQRVPLADLRAAWDVRLPGQARPNTLHILTFPGRAAGVAEIVRSGLKGRAQLFLEPPNGFQGLRGMRKAQADLPRWRSELSAAQLEESLRFLATFTCSVVPNLPQRLLPDPLGYRDPHQAVRDRFAAALAGLAEEYHEPAWAQAAQCFAESGRCIAALTDAAVDALQGDPRALDRAPDLLGQIAALEEEAFRRLA